MKNFIFLCSVTKQCQNSSFYWSISGKCFFSLIPSKHCVKSVQIPSFFWSAFSRIWTEYGKIRTRKNPVFGHISRNETLWYFSDIFRKYRKGTLIKTRVDVRMKNLGIKGLTKQNFVLKFLLIFDWFSKRKKTKKWVVLNGQHSKWSNISARVSQESILGPLLFI